MPKHNYLMDEFADCSELQKDLYEIESTGDWMMQEYFILSADLVSS